MFWNYVSDLHKHVDLLVKYNNQQTLEISNLHGQISADHSVIHDLHNKITYITNQKTASIKVQYHQQPVHKESNVLKELNPIGIAPTAIVIITTIIGSLFKNLIPIF